MPAVNVVLLTELHTSAQQDLAVVNMDIAILETPVLPAVSHCMVTATVSHMRAPLHQQRQHQCLVLQLRPQHPLPPLWTAAQQAHSMPAANAVSSTELHMSAQQDLAVVSGDIAILETLALLVANPCMVTAMDTCMRALLPRRQLSVQSQTQLLVHQSV
jgi:hypothetical protein